MESFNIISTDAAEVVIKNQTAWLVAWKYPFSLKLLLENVSVSYIAVNSQVVDEPYFIIYIINSTTCNIKIINLVNIDLNELPR